MRVLLSDELKSVTRVPGSGHDYILSRESGCDEFEMLFVVVDGDDSKLKVVRGHHLRTQEEHV